MSGEPAPEPRLAVFIGPPDPAAAAAAARQLEAGEIDGIEWRSIEARPERRLTLRGLPAAFVEAIEGQLARLRPGLEREVARALLQRKLEREGGPLLTMAELDELRLQLRLRPDRFEAAWVQVRAILRLRFCGGLIEWPNVDNGRAWAELLHEKRVAAGTLGAAMQRLRRAVTAWCAAADDAAAMAAFAEAYEAVRGAQAGCLHLGMRVADDLADTTFDAVCRRLAGDPYKAAHRRLSAAAAVLGVGEDRVRRVWQDLRVRRDLALRHAYGVLHFNRIRQALLGCLGAWEWPKAAESAELLRRGAIEPPGPEPHTPPPAAPPEQTGGGAQA